MNKPLEDILVMIRDIRGTGKKLSDWEDGFLESIAKQARAGRELSPRQDQILLDLWKKARE